MSTEARVDRRHLRRAETIESLIDVAVEVMAEQGVAGLSLGEVARRMGIRPPSLYVYVDSKNAVYDAVFARGWRAAQEAMASIGKVDETADPGTHLERLTEAFVRWAVENPVPAQLMIWRPVPGYEPSAAAYQHALAAFAQCSDVLTELQRLGLFRPDAAVDELMRAWTVLTTGVVTRQLANAPQESFESGSFTALLPQLLAMYQAHYAPVARTVVRKPTPRRS
jgi:AcrR family transcriptional regulator